MKKLYFTLFILFLFTVSLQAQWDGNTATVDNPVATTTANDDYAYTVSDGAGGIIAVWEVRNDTTYNGGIYCQHKTSAGVLTWGSAGMPVQLFYSAVPYTNVYVVDVEADGNGGAYISWNTEFEDTASVYLQHVDRNGASLFTAGGIKIIPSAGNYTTTGRLCADAAGVFMCWSEEEYRVDSFLPTYAEVKVQRYTAAGQPQWGSAGVAVSTVNSLRALAELVSDGNGGLFVAFLDTRNSGVDAENNFNNLDVYAQHISSSGSRLWPAQDVVVTNEPNNQFPIDDGGSEIFSSMITDSAGGFIMVFDDYRNNNDSSGKLYAQRLNGAGTRLWAAGGVSLFNPAPESYNSFTQLLNDGAGGMIASWDRYDFSGSGNMYAQRITAAGNTPWGTDGLQVSASSFNTGYGQGTLQADGSGNFVAAWSNWMEIAVKGQKVNVDGQLLWGDMGVDICTNPLANPFRPMLTKSTGDNMIVIWGDARNYQVSANDLYAAKMDGSGTLVNSVVYISVANGNWNNPATWQGNMVPPAGADVVIQTAVMGNVNATCSSLTVQQPGSLTVNTGVTITVIQ